MPFSSLIEHVKNAGLIVPSKEIKIVVFRQTNRKIIIKEVMRTKTSQVIAKMIKEGCCHLMDSKKKALIPNIRMIKNAK